MLVSEGTFTEAIAELEGAGYNSMGFAIESSAISCMECGRDASVDTIRVGGMLRYQGTLGEGHVFALGCPACSAKGLLFVAPDASGQVQVVTEALGRRARSVAG